MASYSGKWSLSNVQDSRYLSMFSQTCHHRKLSLKVALLLLLLIYLCANQLLLVNDKLNSSVTQCSCVENFTRNNSLLKSNNIFKEHFSSTKNKILIISEARSGSSFLGDLLQQVATTYYSFEPFIGVEPNSKLYFSLAHKIFHCQFDQLLQSYLKPIYWKIPYFKWNYLLTKAVGLEEDHLQLFNQTVHLAICQSSKIILIKTIRFTLVDWQLSLSQYGSSLSDVKVIYLVRDPRAVMSSRYRLAWCLRTENCTSSEILCQRMKQNLNVVFQAKNTSLADNILLLRHEDLLADMLNTTKRILTFLNMNSMEASLIDWIVRHTSTDDTLANPHSTYRNIKKLKTQWKTHLSTEDVLQIEEDCVDVMRYWGYQPMLSGYTDEIYS